MSNNSNGVPGAHIPANGHVRHITTGGWLIVTADARKPRVNGGRPVRRRYKQNGRQS